VSSDGGGQLDLEMVGDSTRMDFLSGTVVAAVARGLGASGSCRRCFCVDSDEMDVCGV
jgi:hypothetical protein